MLDTSDQSAPTQHSNIEALPHDTISEAYCVFQYNSGPGEDYFPEGGREAWSVVLGAWCAMIPSMGLLNSIGALQAWVSNNQLSNHSGPSVAWIFSIYAFALLLGGARVGKHRDSRSFVKTDMLSVGPLFDTYSARVVILPGSIGITISLLTI